MCTRTGTHGNCRVTGLGWEVSNTLPKWTSSRTRSHQNIFEGSTKVSYRCRLVVTQFSWDYKLCHRLRRLARYVGVFPLFFRIGLKDSLFLWFRYKISLYLRRGDPVLDSVQTIRIFLDVNRRLST